MKIITASSIKGTPAKAVGEIKATFKGFEPKMVIFFASPKYMPEPISLEMKAAFPGSSVIGCSSSGEIISGEMLKGSVVAMGLSSEVLDDVKVEVVRNLREKVNVSDACKNFESFYHEKMADMDVERYLGLVLVDGLTHAEDRLMDSIGSKTNVCFVGGSAGDDLQFKATYVYEDGKSYTNAALLVLMKIRSGFDVIKTQSFNVLNKELVATTVDEVNRTVIEFNNRPAAIAYAEALGVSVDILPSYFITNPLGIILENELFVRSPQIVEGTSVRFYCTILKGMELSLLESANIVEQTAQIIQEKVAEFGNISGLVNFNCILRTLYLEKKGLSKKYADVFKDIPTIGISTYGEQYLGHNNQMWAMLSCFPICTPYGERFLGHINQTATIIVFK